MNWSYLHQISPEYLEALEEQYYEDPSKLPVTWRFFFDGVDAAREEFISNGHHGLSNGKSVENGHTTYEQNFELAILNLIEGYRARGHFLAKLDPLGKMQPDTEHARLDLGAFGLNQAGASTAFQAARTIGLPQAATLNAIIEHLRATYCGTVGAEISHISNEPIRLWLAQKMEAVKNHPPFSLEEKRAIAKELVKATRFEEFIHKNYTGQKRFSLEGGESLIPALQNAIQTAAGHGADEVLIGMAHRGRLSVLTNVVHKPYEKVFTEFEGQYSYEDGERGGDVKYHLGYSKDLDVGGKTVRVGLAFNPSHLETVNAVALGMVRAKQERKGNSSSTMTVLIHGDAAVIGQGIVPETMNMWRLPGYSTGGTLHIVVNNQVGFTTDPTDARSGRYCTDFAKAIEAPIFHVNGNDPEAVVHAIRLATEFRFKFGRDAFVDIVCYRKYGHNEGDEPRFTQPTMYTTLTQTPNPLDAYAGQNESVLPKTEIDALSKEFQSELTAAFDKIHGKAQVIKPDWFNGSWKDFNNANEAEMLSEAETAISKAQLDETLKAIHSWPAGFQPLPKLAKMIEGRRDELAKSGKADWAVGEALAFGTLLLQGYGIRLSGQDAERGTFSHRHAVLNDSNSGNTHTPLASLAKGGVKFQVFNSPLSEYSVMGFDYGFSAADPKTLTIWEGQFGDFSNGAQIIIDQYLSSSEAKWHRLNSLTLLLPHGFEGQGPEHSSARLERYLQLCARGNIQVAYPTTPAQIFHLLRRQMVRKFRKPLIVMTPKSPLRMPEVVSELSEFTKGAFKNIIASGSSKPKRVIFCSGKIYWDLQKYAAAHGHAEDTAYVRIEQLYPLDLNKIKEIRAQFKSAKDWVWAQEEPQNNGAWGFFRLATLDLDLPLRYAGRVPAPSVATGNNKIHQEEQEALLKEAFR